jgi:hypothetical protein
MSGQAQPATHSPVEQWELDEMIAWTDGVLNGEVKTEGYEAKMAGDMARLLIDLSQAHAQAEATAEELKTWRDVFEGYFGPEGRMLEIADKAVQDLLAELQMAQDDKEPLLKALDLAESTLGGAEHCMNCGTCAAFAAQALPVIRAAIAAARPQAAAGGGTG